VQTSSRPVNSSDSAADVTVSINGDNGENDNPADEPDFAVTEIKSEESCHTNGHDTALPVHEFRPPTDVDVKVISNAGETLEPYHLIGTIESATQSKAGATASEHHCKSYTSVNKNLAHQKTVAGEPYTMPKTYKCDLCPKVFKYASYLQVHSLIHMGQKPQLSNDCSKTCGPKIEITTTRLVPQVCNVVREAFGPRSEIRASIQTEEKTGKCRKCGEVCDSASSLRIHTSVCYRQCDVCGKIFSHVKYMKEHKLIHDDVKRYKCSFCDNAFKQSAGLSMHIRRHHGGVIVTRTKPLTPHICEICGKVSKTRTDLRKHAKIHSGNRPYKCDICPKAFTHHASLTVHKRLHSGERPYKCDLCDKAFSHSSPLTTHRRVHTGEKPYKCVICLRAFRALITLKRHKQIHTNERLYKCDLCDKAFTAPNAVASHKLIHSGEKPYKCSLCPKAFRQTSALLCHEQTHGDEKAYKCGMCDKAFKTSGYLNKHVRTHSDKKSRNSPI